MFQPARYWLVVMACGVLQAAVWSEQVASSLSFEAASIRPNTSGLSGSTLNFQVGGRFTASNQTARGLIRLAFPQYSQVRGGPDWVATERFDVVATAGRDATRAEMELMLRSLLEEHFRLRVHVEAEEQDVLALVLAREDRRLGAGLTRSTVDCEAASREVQRGGQPVAPNGSPSCGASESAGVIRVSARPISSVAGMMESRVGKTVVDQTGLAGLFDYTVRYSPDPERPIADYPAIITAVREQLGFRLESTRAPVKVLMIDHIERPTAN